MEIAIVMVIVSIIISIMAAVLPSLIQILYVGLRNDTKCNVLAQAPLRVATAQPNLRHDRLA